MGFLIPLAAMAAPLIAGASTAVGAATAATGMTAAGTALSVGSSLLSGIGGMQQSNYQAQVAMNNATIARQNARAALESGSYSESVSRIKSGKLGATQQTSYAANGIDVASGSAQDVMHSDAAMGEMDALMLRHNAMREAYGYKSQASMFDTEASMDRQAGVGKLVGGIFGAGSSLIGGASSLTNQSLNMNSSAGTSSYKGG